MCRTLLVEEVPDSSASPPIPGQPGASGVCGACVWLRMDGHMAPCTSVMGLLLASGLMRAGCICT